MDGPSTASGGDVFVISGRENRDVATQRSTQTAEDETTEDPKVPNRVEIPDISEEEEFESVNDPGSAEEPDGYGHGV